jgi:hypothetical protein
MKASKGKDKNLPKICLVSGKWYDHIQVSLVPSNQDEVFMVVRKKGKGKEGAVRPGTRKKVGVKRMSIDSNRIDDGNGNKPIGVSGMRRLYGQ